LVVAVNLQTAALGETHRHRFRLAPAARLGCARTPNMIALLPHRWHHSGAAHQIRPGPARRRRRLL